MPRRNITFAVGEHYHVYNRGNDRQPIFFERDNQRFFLRQLRTYVVDHADVLAYCLMPNHYHLLVRLTSDGYSSAMHRFGVSYVKAINRRHERVGALFQGRFRAIHVDREEYLVHLSRYIHLNPVVADLVDRPEHWEFSSWNTSAKGKARCQSVTGHRRCSARSTTTGVLWRVVSEGRIHVWHSAYSTKETDRQKKPGFSEKAGFLRRAPPRIFTRSKIRG